MEKVLKGVLKTKSYNLEDFPRFGSPTFKMVYSPLKGIDRFTWGQRLTGAVVLLSHGNREEEVGMESRIDNLKKIVFVDSITKREYPLYDNHWMYVIDNRIVDSNVEVEVEVDNRVARLVPKAASSMEDLLDIICAGFPSRQAAMNTINSLGWSLVPKRATRRKESTEKVQQIRAVA